MSRSVVSGRPYSINGNKMSAGFIISYRYIALIPQIMYLGNTYVQYIPTYIPTYIRVIRSGFVFISIIIVYVLLYTYCNT